MGKMIFQSPLFEVLLGRKIILEPKLMDINHVFPGENFILLRPEKVVQNSLDSKNFANFFRTFLHE